MNKLGIDCLCGFGMPPVAFTRLAAELGCNSVSLNLSPNPGFNPDRHPAWSLRDDPALRRDTAAAARDTGVCIGMVEGFVLIPGRDIRAYAADLDIVCEIDSKRIAANSADKDLQKTIDGFVILAEMAAERGLLVSAEMGSMGPYGQVEAALALVRGVGKDNFNLLIDSMHFLRLGNTIEQFAALDPALIGYVQLCDAPLTNRFDTYMEEAMYERLAPGDGELPLREFVKLIPPDVTVSLEIPMRALAEQGLGPRERIAPCVDAAREMLAGR